MERKHAQDKRFETTKVTSCARASRNAILGRYLSSRAALLNARATSTKKQKATRTLNIRALAIERKPELFPRGRGQLWWQDVAHGSRSDLTHAGDNVALNAYVDAHREELETELQARRAAAEFQAQAEKPLPISSTEWMECLEQHDELFCDLLKSASSQRRALSERLEPMLGLDEQVRVYPQAGAQTGHSPHWAHLDCRFYCFAPNSDLKLVVYLASIGHCVYACPLNMSEKSREYDLLLQPLFCEGFKPIAEVFRVAGVPAASTRQSIRWTAFLCNSKKNG